MPNTDQTEIWKLKDGLVMRRGALADAERLPAFNARIHGEDPQDAEAVAAWTLDLLTTQHPTFHPEDFLIVEDPATGEIVSSSCLISQTWSYEGIAFGVGRPELVGTDPNYRGKGLVRVQFDLLHAWSRQRGELVQAITGIPYFYRQFGYEMGLELGGGRVGYAPQVPQLEEGQVEPYHIRPVEETDVPYLAKVYAKGCYASMVSAVWDEALFINELRKRPQNVNRVDLRMIETREGQPVGFLAHPGTAWRNSMSISRYMLDEGVSYLAVTPSVIRYLWKTGESYTAQGGRKMEVFAFRFGSQHPAYQAAAGRLVSENKPYAYYVRVADLPAFLTRIRSILESRLKESVCAGHTGEIKISFYRSGIRLAFEQGRLVQVEPWKPILNTDEGAAAFPDLTFLQLVFGYRAVDDLVYAFADCHTSPEAQVLLGILFPKKPSSIWGIT